MTDTPTEMTSTNSTTELAAPIDTATLSTNEPGKQAGPTAGASPKKDRFAAVAPVLEKLFELYPHLFGQRFVPLKLGVFQDLLAAHPTELKRDTLKAALAVHTRSTRYLQSVAAGTKRHDLSGQPVDDVAPEHVFLSIVELHQRRQARTPDDLLPKLQRQLVTAYAASGLSRQDYLSRLPALADSISAVLDEAMVEVDQQRARQAALVKAYQSSGKAVNDFADDLGMDAARLSAVLKQAGVI